METERNSFNFRLLMIWKENHPRKSLKSNFLQNCSLVRSKGMSKCFGHDFFPQQVTASLPRKAPERVRFVTLVTQVRVF